jgi:hypothetical protein
MKGFIVAIATLLVSARAEAQWDPELPLTATGGDIFGEGLAASGTTIHVIYGNSDVRYRRSTDDGATWSTERTLDSGVIHLTDPLVADGNDVWAIYLKNTVSKMDWCCPRDAGDIYLLHSGDGGTTWDQPKRLTTGAAAFRISIAYDANKLHVVWMDYRDNEWDTYYLRSADRGATWDPEKVIANSMGTFGAERPQVAARGDGVHVTIWDDRGTNPPCGAGPTFDFTVCPDTFYIGSLDGGATWGAIAPVHYSGAAFAGRNDIAVAGTQSVIVNFNRAAEGTDDANPHMFTVRSPDNGATWDTPVQLTNTPGSSDHGSIIGSGRSVFLAWHDSRTGTLAIHYSHSVDEGVTWIPDEKASTTTAEASTPLLATTAGYVHALWLDKGTGPFQIMYRRRARPTEPAAPDAGVGGGGDAGTKPGDDGGGCCSSTSVVPNLAPLVAFLLLLRPRRRRAQTRR